MDPLVGDRGTIDMPAKSDRASASKYLVVKENQVIREIYGIIDTIRRRRRKKKVTDLRQGRETRLDESFQAET